ncbi:MAG: c-type cytochrome [Bacteriovoracaceae bacterium]|nr:c-type cytochrome [Bacteriovoracaceae bacterium]
MLRKIFILGLFLSMTHAMALTPEEANTLIKRSGCIACHDTEKSKIGPSYKEVANRYRDTSKVSYLSGKTPATFLKEKVRSGSMKDKRWSDKYKGMMTPNPVSRISDADLEAVIKYILELK